VSEYYFLNAQLEKLRQTLRDTVNQPIHSLQYLQPGRLARVRTREEPILPRCKCAHSTCVSMGTISMQVKDGTQDWGWGVIVNFQKKLGAKSQSGAEASDYVVDMLLDCVKGPNGKPQPVSSNPLAEVEMQVIPVLLPLLDGMSSVRIFVPKDLRPFDNRCVASASVLPARSLVGWLVRWFAPSYSSPRRMHRRSVSKALREVMKRFPTGLPLLDPIEDMRIEEPAFKKLIRVRDCLHVLALEHTRSTHSALIACMGQ